MSKPVYVSLNMSEYEALMSRASFQEITMYLILKKLANFKTGQVGSFRQQKLNYEKLAGLLSRPTRNTAPAEIYDRGQARAIVLRLEKIGLVSKIHIEDDALKMWLHLSPIKDFEDKEAPSEVSPGSSLEKVQKPQQPVVDRSSLMPVDPQFWDDDPFAINTDDHHQYTQYHHLSHTDTNGNNDKGEDTSPSVALGNIHPDPSLKKADVMSAKLTIENIRNGLGNAGFRLLDHSVSQSIFKGWVNMGVDQSEINSAIFELQSEGGDLVAGELDKTIRGIRKKGRVSTGRGSVAL